MGRDPRYTHPGDLGVPAFKAPRTKEQWDQHSGFEAGALGLRTSFSVA